MPANNKKMDALRQSNAESNALTKESIETALLALMKEKNFSSITITDIAKKAGVSRLAYYRNYSSKGRSFPGSFRTSFLIFTTPSGCTMRSMKPGSSARQSSRKSENMPMSCSS